MFQFRVLLIWIPRYLAVLVLAEIVVVYGVGGFAVTFVGNARGLEFLWVHEPVRLPPLCTVYQ